MGEEILVTGVGEILKKVCSLAAHEIGLACGVKGQLKKLKQSFSTIQAVLIDAERRQVEEETVKLWLKRLKQVAYDAEDVLDEFATELLRRNMEVQNRFKSKVRNFFSLTNPIAFRLKIAHKIMDINQALAEIEKDKVMFKFNEITVNSTHPDMGERKTSSRFDVSKIVGRETDKSKIVDLLINSRDEKVSVVSIMGVGGLGKTTLAQIVYQDKLIDEFFDLRIWVCVSEVFDVKRILSEMIESISRAKCDLSNMDAMVGTLQEKISGKRFLLILDDVWNEECDKWERLKTLIGDGARGSKILVTTRSGRVASTVGSFSRHDLDRLLEEESWGLFKQWAFRDGEADVSPNLEKIGMDIVSRCGGVPLALMHLGSLMQFKKDEHEWQRIRDSKIWELPENKKVIGILKLSYDNLSSPLKQCFSYCAMFPKDKLINKKMLIQMWMAEGFLEPPKGSSLWMEEVGDEYCNALMLNSFFQDVEKDELGCIREFKMHDLVHDLACSVVGYECCFENLERVEDVDKIHRLSSASKLINALPKTNKLRTFILRSTMPKYSMKVEFNSGFLRLKYLRVLDLHGPYLTELPSSVCELRHLRYLDLSETHITTLPDSLCSLYNLQTLRLVSCEDLLELPKDMRKLINLRHLEIQGCKKLVVMPRDIGQLSSLQTLSRFILGEEGSGCSIRELQCLNLGGKLKIKGLEKVTNATDAAEANLENKSNIQNLGLCWSGSSNATMDPYTGDDVLEALRPHSNLKILKIHNFLGGKIPKWMNVTFLPNLVEMHLIGCEICEHLPPLGQLRLLRVLVIYRMKALRFIGEEFYGHVNNEGSQEVTVVFPSLRTLNLSNLPNLEEWMEPSVNSCRYFPLLESLAVQGCSKLTKTPTLFPTLKKLNVFKGSNILLQSLTCKLSSLTYLRICYIQNMSFLPQGLLQKNNLLRELYIHGCTELLVLPMEELQDLKSLETLMITGGKSLTSLSDLQLLTSLRSLRLTDLKEMSSLHEWLHRLPFLEELGLGSFGEELDVFPLEGIQQIVSLQSLCMYGWPNVKSLPEQLGHLTTLQGLYIHQFENIVALPDSFQNLSSLQHLFISKCKNLMHLPEGIQYLTSLKHLTVHDCPLLKERYGRETGKEWHKIVHIPYIVL